MNRGRDDVRRVLAGELNEVLPEVAFDGRYAGVGQPGVQPDLLRDHRFAFDDAGDLMTARNLENRRARVVAVGRPMHPATVSLDLAFELNQEAVEVDERVRLDVGRPLPQQLPIGSRRRALLGGSVRGRAGLGTGGAGDRAGSGNPPAGSGRRR